MAKWIETLMNPFGIVFLMFLENVFPPVPSELIMPLAGFEAGQGKFPLWVAILCGVIGSLIGQLPLYYLGKVLGEEKLAKWADKHGHWLTISGDEIHKSVEWFNKHGKKAVVFARVVPGVRSLISIPAGITGMNLVQFLLYSYIGTGIWAGSLAYAGYLLKDQYTIVEKYLGPATYIILGGIALYMIVNIIKRKREKSRGGKDEQKSDDKNAQEATAR